MNKKIEVTRWAPPPVSAGKAWPNRRALALPPAIAGMLGTVMVHAVLFQAAVLGARALHRQPPQAPDVEAATSTDEPASAEGLVLVALAPAVPAKPAIAIDLSAMGFAPDTLAAPLSVAMPPRVPTLTDLVGDDTDTDTGTTSGDAIGRSRLFGLYSGQIQARIERLWRRPRTPVDTTRTATERASSDMPFRCQVEIIQDAMGNVEEVLLPHCHGSAAWQRSLVLAVQQASPLPAPPNPAVFARAVTVSFVGFPYARGAEESEYEIESTRVAQGAE